jgi:hypothetical protein
MARGMRLLTLHIRKSRAMTDPTAPPMLSPLEYDDSSGAVALDSCWLRWCQHGKCARCNYPMHSAIHGPLWGQPAGSKPYGHRFVPRAAETP